MALNKQKKGNMYGFITDSWNPIRGICLHRCKYCYARRVQSQWGVVSLNEKCLNDKLGKQRSIFVGSSTDMWGRWVSPANIRQVLTYCQKFNSNSYLFQTKNPVKWEEFSQQEFPRITTLATTIESNRDYPKIGLAPKIEDRVKAMQNAKQKFNFSLMVTVEPVLDFDVDELVDMLRLIGPYQVNIGADSKRHNLPEPSVDKVLELTAKLKMFTRVYKKENLVRVLEG